MWRILQYEDRCKTEPQVFDLILLVEKAEAYRPQKDKILTCLVPKACHNVD